MASNALMALLEAKEFIAAPGVFDMVSAKLADRTEAKALYMTGFGIVSSYLGLPDAGLATYSQMLDRVEAIYCLSGRICKVRFNDYFRPARKARISRSMSGSFDKNM
jgi:hypothetical protein